VRPVLQRLAAIALLVAGVFLGGRLLGVFDGGLVPVEIHYVLGTPPVATALEARFHRPGKDETLASFETRLVGPDVAHETRLPAGEIVLEITLVAPGGGRRSLTRTIRAERGAVIRLQLAQGEGMP
jgi:hypothetical protein